VDGELFKMSHQIINTIKTPFHLVSISLPVLALVFESIDNEYF
jgi:hypothetical protein